MICIDCNGRIKPDEDYDELPGKQFIHSDCATGLLNRPDMREKKAKTTQTSQTASREFSAWRP